MTEPNKAGSPDGGAGGNPSDGGNGAPDGGNPKSEEQVKALANQVDSLTAKLNETTTLLTGAQKEIGRAREDAKTWRKKSQEGAKAADANSAAEEDIQKRIQAINDEHKAAVDSLTGKNEKLTDKVKFLSINSAIETAALRHGAIKPSMVVNELKGLVRLDDETLQPVVIDADGHKEWDGKIHMSIDTFVANYLANPENNFLLHANKKQGAGSAPAGSLSGGTVTFTQDQIDKMTPAEFARNRKAILAQQRGK